MTSQEMPPPMALFRMITGFYVSRAVHVAAGLGIADLLSEGAVRWRVAREQRTATHAPSLNAPAAVADRCRCSCREARSVASRLRPSAPACAPACPARCTRPHCCSAAPRSRPGASCATASRPAEPRFAHVFGSNAFEFPGPASRRSGDLRRGDGRVHEYARPPGTQAVRLPSDAHRARPPAHVRGLGIRRRLQNQTGGHDRPHRAAGRINPPPPPRAWP